MLQYSNESKEYKEKYMVLAKVTSKGQVTVPIEIRQKLNINEGNKILFYENDLGQVIIENANVKTFHDIKKYGRES